MAAEQIRRRRVDPDAGRALVVLSHAIEYLADEFVYSADGHGRDRGRIEAIQLLMAKNRDIYLACPQAPTLWQALCSQVHKQLTQAPDPHYIGFKQERN